MHRVSLGLRVSSLRVARLLAVTAERARLKEERELLRQEARRPAVRTDVAGARGVASERCSSWEAQGGNQMERS